MSNNKPLSRTELAEQLTSACERIKKQDYEEAIEALYALAVEIITEQDKRIAELEQQVKIVKDQKEDVLAFIKRGGRFAEYYDGAGNWDNQESDSG